VLKVKGGKMIKVALRLKEGSIEEVRITGDFFVYPEGAVEVLEGKLKGMPSSAIRGEIERLSRDLGIRAVGFNLEDLINMIQRCMR
jgi:lipoate-protein ligase A